MINKVQKNQRRHLYSSPWIIIGSVIILLVVVLVLAFQNYSREKKYMSRILSEKGAAIIKAVEAGTRTGMMEMMWGGEQIQALVQETALLPDVLYITITDSRGLVLASSRKNLIGSRINIGDNKSDFKPSAKIKWHLKKTDRQERSFEVYRYFQPLSNCDSRDGRFTGHMPQHRKAMQSNHNWCFPTASDIGNKIILVGLNPLPFEEGRREDARNTIVISVVLVILGLAGFFSMFWMESYRSAHKSLQDTSAIADQIVASLPVGLIATDKNGKISFYNRAAEQITGLDFSKAQGKDPDIILPSQFCGLKNILELGRQIYEHEMECEFVEGKMVPLSISAAQIINKEGDFVGQVLILKDLGEVRRLQDEVRRKEKLAAIGELAAGVAHEIRNPLSSIKGIASYYKSKFKNGSEDAELAGVMIEEVDRLSRVIGELLEFARPTQLNLKPTEINELLKHSVKLVQQEATENNVEIVLNLSKAPIEAKVDPDRLSQCFLNLLLNALQAMKDGGRLTISDSITNNGNIDIRIQDNGNGIYPDKINKIFDPYFTTKPKGTGLGLAIVHKIVEAHKGQIKVHSKVGKGTTVSIILPVEKQPQL